MLTYRDQDDELDREHEFERDLDAYSRRSPLHREITRWWEARGVMSFRARGYADDQLVPDEDGHPVPWCGTADQQERLRTRATARRAPVKAPDPQPVKDEARQVALERARVQLQDKQVRLWAIIDLWVKRGEGAVTSRKMATADRLPVGPDDDVAWTGSAEQVEHVLAAGWCPPDPNPPSEPQPEPAPEPEPASQPNPEPDPATATSFSSKKGRPGGRDPLVGTSSRAWEEVAFRSSIC